MRKYPDNGYKVFFLRWNCASTLSVMISFWENGMMRNRSFGEKNTPTCDSKIIRLIFIIGILLVMSCSLVSAESGTGATIAPVIQTLNVTPAAPEIQPVTGSVVSQTLIGTPSPTPEINMPSVQQLGVADPVLEQAFIDHKVMRMHNITTADRFAAADRAEALGLGQPKTTTGGNSIMVAPPSPGGPPDYFGTNANYALSQLPVPADALGNATAGTGIRKFVDTLPGLRPLGANNLGQYIPVAVADTTSYPNNDSYEIALVDYVEQMHSDLNSTTLRGYVQLETPANAGPGSKHLALRYLNGSPILNAVGAQVFAYENPHYLGPLIIATKDRATRIKFHNYLGTGTNGNLFIPTDHTIMGQGNGPLGAGAGDYTENRATLHLHGGNTPWISDGTPHQWTTPAGQVTSYPEGVSVKNVPDMDGGVEPVGTLTFYYTNQQSARLMFYHDHAMGITRLNVYAGEAAGYLVTDQTEKDLIYGTNVAGANPGLLTVLPGVGTPLVIQDKSFVPNATQMQNQDPTWNWGANASRAWPKSGELYYPHVYMPAQNLQNFGVNPMGRWDYGAWAQPPRMGFLHPDLPNTYYDPVLAPWEPPRMPGTLNPSQVPETFLDTPMVNGNPYPVVQVGATAVRFRILNAAQERFWNLQLYNASSSAPMWAGTALLNKSSGEVTMVPAVPTAGWPAEWPTDLRPGGVPDPTTRGPQWIQIGTEGGFLPAPAVINATPIGYNTLLRSTVVIPVTNHSLYLGPAERADVIVDFSGYPNGAKLILYNDAPAPAPGFDTRYDFYTGDADQTAIGGAPTTLAGYGPNTRTIMQIQVNTTLGNTAAYNRANLNTALPAAYAVYQDKPIVPQAAYNTPFGAVNTNNYVKLENTSVTFTPMGAAAPVTMNMIPKAIVEGFEPNYGRITAVLGVEIPRSSTNLEQAIGYGYADPPTEVFNNSEGSTALIGTLGDGTQIWKFTHNGVDTHIMHWHMYNLQVINRISWDGTVLPPHENELGWKESVQVNALEDIIVAMRPIKPVLPWELPNSIRPLNPLTPLGSSAPMEFIGLDPSGGQAPVVNRMVNFGWEYVWHCHLLGHEEQDMMRSQAVAVAPRIPPSNLTAKWIGPNTSPNVTLTWKDNSVSETNWSIQRALSLAGPWIDIARAPSTTGPQSGGMVTYNNAPVALNTTYYYRVMATNVVGDTTVYSGTVGYPNIAVNSTPSNVATQILSNVKIGIYQNGSWYLDKNGTANVPTATYYSFGAPGWQNVTGDWTGDGKTKIGVYQNGSWYLDKVGTGSAATATFYGFGAPGWTPVVGDWTGDGKTKIGVYQNGSWYLDKVGTGSAATATLYGFGAPSWKPVVGDWNGDGKTKVGIYKNGSWYLDKVGTGSAATATLYGFGAPGWTPVVADWNGDRITELGVYQNGSWYLDKVGTGSAATSTYYVFGSPGFTPITGVW